MPRINKTRYALLGFLSMESSTGYDIKKHMEQSTNHFWREGDSSIYPILRQLLEEGLVHCETETTIRGKTKKVYTITKNGQTELENWLVKEPEPFQSRDELLLKVFFCCNVDADITRQHVEKLRSQL